MTTDDLEPYLSLVEELAEEDGFEMAEIAAAAAQLARGRPAARRRGAAAASAEAVPAGEDGMVRLFIDAGRTSGVGPADIVGAIANEAGVPGKAIGAIDIYDRFTFVEVPAEYRDQILERMVNVEIRNRPVLREARAALCPRRSRAGSRPQAWGRDAGPEGRQAAFQGAGRESEAPPAQGETVGPTATADRNRRA